MRPTLRWRRLELIPPSQWPGYEQIVLLLATLWALLLVATGVYLLLRYRPVLGSEVAGAFLAGVVGSPRLYLILFGLVAVYVSDVFFQTRVRKGSRALWTVALILGSLVVMPVYWYLYIWREPSVCDIPPDA